MVAYNRDIPDAPNNPSVDQPKMKTNTNSIDTILAVDHISFNATDGGYHKVVHSKDNVVDPAIVAGFGEYYAKTISGDVQAFYRSSLGTIYQLTGNATSFSLNGYTTLPNGLILQWGRAAALGAVVFPIAFPTNVFNVQVSPSASGATVAAATFIINLPTTLGFNIFLGAGNATGFGPYYWMAIGN